MTAFGTNTGPAVSILRQAMDVIRREALKSDIETGGILIGARSEDGAVLVTHATPPGPAAVHNAVFFQRDVAFQQSILNDLHRRYGVQYLGEWHKHPRNLPVPSGGDLSGVKDLLADPDYGVDTLLFPIVICERDLGFQIHPFCASSRDSSIEFRPMVWHELTVELDPDQIFSEQISSPVVDQDAEEARDREPEEVVKPSSSPLRGWFSMEKFLPFFAKSNGDLRDDKPSRGTESFEIAPSEIAPPWHQTPEGCQRLGQEQKLLRSFGLAAEPFMIGDDHLCFSFSRSGGREIVAICSSSHPEESPQLLVRDAPGEKHRPLEVSGWTNETHLANIVVPLLGPRVRMEHPEHQEE